MLDLYNKGPEVLLKPLLSWSLGIFLQFGTTGRLHVLSLFGRLHTQACVSLPACICKSTVVHRRVTLQT